MNEEFHIIGPIKQKRGVFSKTYKVGLKQVTDGIQRGVVIGFDNLNDAQSILNDNYGLNLRSHPQAS